MRAAPTTSCPTCRRPTPVPADDQPMGHYPFCSERCKLVDLGRWLDGKYQIPVVEKDESADEATPRSHPGDAGGPYHSS